MEKKWDVHLNINGATSNGSALLIGGGAENIPHFSIKYWKQKIVQNWFVLGLLITILLAKLSPSFGVKEGPLNPEITVKYLAVSIIFFNSGLSLKTNELRDVFFHVKLHALIQTFSLIGIPIMMTAIVSTLQWTTTLNPYLCDGLLVLACMPPPVSSAVILTKAVGGNEAAAIFNSTFGNQR